MAPLQRPPPKSPNRHTTPRRRNRIVAASAAGATAAQIASEEGIPKATVYGVRRRFKHQDWGVSPKGRGRPRKDDTRRTKTATADDLFIIHSLDPKSIEKLWKLLKERIGAREQSLVQTTNNEASLQRLRTVVTDVWGEMEQSLIDDLMKSRPLRSHTVGDSQGRRIGY